MGAGPVLRLVIEEGVEKSPHVDYNLASGRENTSDLNLEGWVSDGSEEVRKRWFDSSSPGPWSR